MDAHNLAIVFCPNLAASKNPTQDVAMCGIFGAPDSSQHTTPAPPNSSASVEGRTTLAMVIKLCIQRYYEVFDEVFDRSEAVGSLDGNTAHDEDEDIDDAMLVMPIGPSTSGQGDESRPGPSAWKGTSTSRTRGKSSSMRSTHTISDIGNPGPFATSRAKSLITIEQGVTGGSTGRKGSITIGRGTTRKSAGAAVEAIGVTAAGFFSPPQRLGLSNANGAGDS